MTKLLQNDDGRLRRCRIRRTAGQRLESCPPAVVFLRSRFAAAFAGRGYPYQAAALVGIHLAALGVLLWTEETPVAQAAFVLTWGLLNCCWLVLLRRPLPAAAISLALIVA